MLLLPVVTELFMKSYDRITFHVHFHFLFASMKYATVISATNRLFVPNVVPIIWKFFFFVTVTSIILLSFVSATAWYGCNNNTYKLYVQ